MCSFPPVASQFIWFAAKTTGLLMALVFSSPEDVCKLLGRCMAIDDRVCMCVCACVSVCMSVFVCLCKWSTVVSVLSQSCSVTS